MQQQRSVPSDTRLPLPATVALDILLAANTIRRNPDMDNIKHTVTLTFSSLARGVRQLHLFCRAEIGTRCLTGDLTVDRPSQQICLFVRKCKGDQRRDTRNKLVLAVPITTNPLLADLLEYYLAHRSDFCTT
jgi:hypothetical protein